MSALGVSANVIVALFVLISRVHSQDCLQNTPVYGNKGGGGVPRLNNDNLYLIPSYSFSCHGNVTQWRACVERGGGRERYTIIFYVFRRSTKPMLPNCYTVVGRTSTLTDAMPEHSCVTLDLASADQVSVQPGDVVGVLPMSTKVGNGIEIDVSVTGVTAFYAPMSAIFAGSLECAFKTAPDGNLPSSVVSAPVITAVVAPFPTPSPSPSVSPAASPFSSPSQTTEVPIPDPSLTPPAPPHSISPSPSLSPAASPLSSPSQTPQFPLPDPSPTPPAPPSPSLSPAASLFSSPSQTPEFPLPDPSPTPPTLPPPNSISPTSTSSPSPHLPPGSSSPSSFPSSPPGSSSFPNIAMILGLVVAGVAAIVVVVLVVVILVILCGMRSHCRCETAPLDNRSDNDKHAAIQSLMNPNYDERKEFTAAITMTTTNGHSNGVYEMVDRPTIGTLNNHPPPINRFSVRNSDLAPPPKPPPKNPGAENSYTAVGTHTHMAPPPSAGTDHTYFTLEPNPPDSVYSDLTVPAPQNSGSTNSDPTVLTPQNPDSVYSDPMVIPGPARQNSGTAPLPVYHVLESGGYHKLERGSGPELGGAVAGGHTYHKLERGSGLELGGASGGGHTYHEQLMNNDDYDHVY